MTALQSVDLQEAAPLARQMATALARMLDDYRKGYKISADQADAKHRENAESYEELIDSKPDAHMDWYEMNFLFERNLEKWQQR